MAYVTCLDNFVEQDDGNLDMCACVSDRQTSHTGVKDRGHTTNCLPYRRPKYLVRELKFTFLVSYNSFHMEIIGTTEIDL